jgi:hypothetical protein
MVGLKADVYSDGRYLTSNVEIEVDKRSVPIGERFAKFTTERYVHLCLNLT